jgi:hypothetical protein
MILRRHFEDKRVNSRCYAALSTSTQLHLNNQFTFDLQSSTQSFNMYVCVLFLPHKFLNKN